MCEVDTVPSRHCSQHLLVLTPMFMEVSKCPAGAEGSPSALRMAKHALGADKSHCHSARRSQVPVAADWAEQSVLPSYHGIDSVELATDGGYH